MIKPARLKLFAALCLASLSLATASGCASTEKQTAEESSKKKKKKDEIPKNYSLFKKRELRQEYLKRGQKAMVNPALDSY